ncbi:MAG: hypothetical protein Q9162_000843 [Coniocarpon cinnabarinum]
MTDFQRPYPTSRGGALWYRPHRRNISVPRFPSLLAERRSRCSRITTAEILGAIERNHKVLAGTTRKPPKASTRSKTRLATAREDTFRRLRSLIASHSAGPKEELLASNSSSRRGSRQEEPTVPQDMPGTDFLRAGPRNLGSRTNSVSNTSTATTSPARSRQGSLVDANGPATGTSSTLPEERPVAIGHGVSVSINLAEPVLFLQGFEPGDVAQRNTAMLRGTLHLKVLKSAKIKAVSLRFKGTASTKWPEGIPPKKLEFEETDTLMNHCWPFFNAQFSTAEGGTGADVVKLAQPSEKHGSPYLSPSPLNSSVNVRDTKRLSLQVNKARSFEKDEKKPGSSVAQKGYRTFHPGDYVYNFELPIDSRLPESIDAELGFVKYELEAFVERAGAFRANMMGSKEVVLIRAPAEGSLEQVEPIAISRNWEDQLHYDIVISGKSFPLGSKVPIAFKLTPLAKVQCHRIKVFITENTEYFCSGKRVHRMEPTRKVLLFEKRSDGPSVSRFPGSSMKILSGGGIPYDQRDAAKGGQEVIPVDTSNLLGRLEGDSNIGPTEMEFNVQLPGCQDSVDKEQPSRLNFDTTYTNIQVHHWIKIVMRLSKPDDVEPGKRRHFEISIDSPFHILSCRASQANTALPAYSSPETADHNGTLLECGCPGAPVRRISPNQVPTLNALNETRTSSISDGSGVSQSRSGSSQDIEPAPAPGIARPALAHIHTNTPSVQRPMHMLRAPSFNPPAFEEEAPPPPMVTPPPQYNDIASPNSGLTDYFTRFAEAYEEDSDDENGSGSRSGRVDVPLTPGGRVNRSMELQRGEWQANLPTR